MLGAGDIGRGQPMPSQVMAAAAAGMAASNQPISDAKAKAVLKEAVDAVVNSFAKHSHGYGRGKKAIYMKCDFIQHLFL